MSNECSHDMVEVQKRIEWDVPEMRNFGKEVVRIRKKFKVMKCTVCGLRWWKNA